MKNSIFAHLNEKQKQAVATIDGPVLILAGPGSGKTRTLTARVAHLLAMGIPGDRILALTFTNKAAQEMRERIVQIVKTVQNDRAVRNGFNIFNSSNGFNQLFIGTFHSFCVRILRLHAIKIGYTPYFTIFDDEDSLNLIKNILKNLNLSKDRFNPLMVAKKISGIKIGGVWRFDRKEIDRWLKSQCRKVNNG